MSVSACPRVRQLQPSHTSAADEAGVSPPTLGQLLLSLRYNHGLGRMTVFLRRGDNLPDSRGLVSDRLRLYIPTPPVCCLTAA